WELSRLGNHGTAIRGSKAGLLRGEPRQRRPITVAGAASETAEEMIAHQACHRHRHLEAFRSGEREADIFQPEPHRETRRLVFAGGDEGAVGSVNLCAEQGAGHDLEEALGIDPGLADEGEGFAKAFEHRGNEEIAGKLHGTRVGWSLADREGLLAHYIE